MFECIECIDTIMTKISFYQTKCFLFTQTVKINSRWNKHLTGSQVCVVIREKDFTETMLQIPDRWTTAAIFIQRHFADYLGQAEKKRQANKYSSSSLYSTDKTKFTAYDNTRAKERHEWVIISLHLSWLKWRQRTVRIPNCLQNQATVLQFKAALTFIAYLLETLNQSEEQRLVILE